ncbi:MFS transporter [Fimbriiglobus ruber]|uniref:D-glucarate permease n=1 Tax=Fimbriiglobus ruber TaxID=1908690 RepID=A0A225DC73_9BACT|nr:MFS transporter [Fimbriiglobus ruber]OWK38583.1 D-glucarate permease [Fimbriiglobus ruber]
MSVPESPGPRPTAWRWWVAALLLMATTLNYMDRITLNLTASDIKAAFGLNNVLYSRLESGFQIAFGVGAILTGVLVDRFGVRLVYPLAVLGWSVAGFLTGFAPEYWVLFGCRFALGIFEAGNWPCGVRTVRQVMPPRERSLGNAIFQSGTGLGAMITPLVVAKALSLWASPDDPMAWQIPFRVIGLIGGGWIGLWLLTVPGRVVDPANAVAAPTPTPGKSEPFVGVFADRRFWILAILVCGVNTPWHTFRVWLPLLYREQMGYSKENVTDMLFYYYAVADVGSWVVGLSVLGLTWAGVRLHTSRLVVFATGLAFVAASALLPWHKDLGENGTLAVTLVTAFGALGLFTLYFALSQEMSSKHQGKVTGSLGCVNSVYLAAVYAIEGYMNDRLGNYDYVLALACIPALLALVAVLAWWPRSTQS